MSARKRLLVGLSICLGAAAVSAPSVPPEAERSNPRERSAAWRGRYGPRAPELAAQRLELAREEAQRWAHLLPRNPAQPEDALAPQQLAAVQGLEWVNLGPTDARFQYNGGVYSQVDSGRATGIAVHPTQPNIIYTSTAGGGIWKTFEFGALNPRWYPIAETLPNLAIGALAMDPRLPDTLYAGLGDAFDVPGGQVVKTTTGGAAWSAPVTLPGATSIRALAVDPLNSNIVLAGTEVLNAPLGPETQVRALDAFNNLATGFTGPISVALGNNPTAATLNGTLTVNAMAEVATFTDLRLGTAGTGHTLVTTSPGLLSTESGRFDVVQARLVYTEPTPGKLRLLRNPASTDTLLVLDLVAAENLTGYGVGINLPVELNRVRLDSLVPGNALPAGSNPVAARAALPLSGPMQGILTAVQSQKASGTGAVATDTAVPAGAVLYTLRLSLASSSPGLIFDGASLGTAFNAAMRDKLGNDVVRRTEFGIGRLEVLSP